MKALTFLTKLKQSRDFDGNLEYSLDEAIAELEELMKPKSCEGCKLVYSCKFSIKQKINNSDGYDVIITIPRKAFYCSKYEPKEQL